MHLLDGARYDVGNRLRYLKATVEYGVRISGVSEILRDYLKSIVD